MCQSVVVLVQAADRRCVARCEHGMIHLMWDRATLHLHLDNFLQAAQFLELAHIHIKTCDLCGNHYFCLMRGEDTRYQMWLLGTGLSLSEDDLHMLVELVRDATGRLKEEPATATELERERLIDHAGFTPPGTLFSDN